MTNEKKEQIGIMLNLMPISYIGPELRSYCEGELVEFLKDLGTSKDKCKDPEDSIKPTPEGYTSVEVVG